MNSHNECLISLKDHKPNFTNNLKTRHINPGKNESGRLSKSILDKINNKLINTTRLNQWKDTSEVINWFNKTEEKSKHTFKVLDIKDLYPSITKYLLKKALEFAKAKVSIIQEEEKLIYHSRKSLRFKDQETWMKKGGELFDLTMGAYDGAKICELIGLFILYKFQQLNKTNNFGLYRDDGLAVIRNMCGPYSEKVKKELRVLFKKFGLNFIIECSKTTVDNLDITLNLLDGTYKPYQKAENTLQYIHKESNQYEFQNHSSNARRL